MKVLFLVKSNDAIQRQLLINQAMALLSFDVEIRVVFCAAGLQSMTAKSWKGIELYADDVFFSIAGANFGSELELPVQIISEKQFEEIILSADLIL